jgi:1-acyl-sn-glycerol-3-phosphate acyltransferase
MSRETADPTPERRFSPLWYEFGRIAFGLIYRTAFRLRVYGAHNIPPPGGFLIASNHESYLDPPLIGVSFPFPIHYFARNTLFDNRVLGFLLPRANVLPIVQDRPDIRGIRNAIRTIESGRPLVVFPEGSRTLDGNLQPGQPGVGLLVAKANAPVLPVRIRGTHAAWPRGSSRIRPRPVSLTIGQLIERPVPAPGLRGQDAYQSISDQIMAAIAAL